jgi:3,4-dihydroxy-2-butanone 4-phosphate synthase
MDDEGRENEGDLVCAAGKVTTEGMAWMIRWTRWVMSGPDRRVGSV